MSQSDTLDIPEINELNIAFLYMIANNYIETVETKTSKEIIIELDNFRLRSVAKNYSLFLNSNISGAPFGTSSEIIDFIDSDAVDGQLYSINMENYNRASFENTSSEWYNHFLFLDIVRDGMRLITPIYKLFHLSDDTLGFNTAGANTGFELQRREGDKFLIARGDTLRVILRQLRKQVKFKEQVSLEHAGVSSKFSDDQI